MGIAVKVCGLSTPQGVDAAVTGGARYVGFVFFPPSPRYVTPDTARVLSERVPATLSTVAVVVDPNDDDLADLVEKTSVDIIQLHGKEGPERVAAIRERIGKPVIKAISVAAEQDLGAVATYAKVADMLLFDAKAKAGDTRPGGNARTFDWSLLLGRTPKGSWLLSGGLSTENLSAAVHATKAPLVDVSSGVERAPGVKDPALIKSFLKIANDL